MHWRCERRHNGGASSPPTYTAAMAPSIRPLLAETDSPYIAQLMRDYGFPRATDDGMRDYLIPKPTQTRLTLVPVDDASPTPTVIGYADIFHQAPAPAGKFQLFLLVAPAFRRQVIGARLYDAAVTFAATNTLRELRV